MHNLVLPTFYSMQFLLSRSCLYNYETGKELQM